MAYRPVPADYGQPGASRSCEEALTRVLPALQPLLQDPSFMPGWSAGRWRRVLAGVRPDRHLPELLAEPRLRPLLIWVTSQSSPSRHLGTVAAVLAVLDDVVSAGESDTATAAARVIEAARTARQLAPRYRTQARMFSSADMDHQVSAPLPGPAADSPFVGVASLLLRQAGFDLRGDPALARRLAAALDVAVEHWMEGAEPGGGLPTFRPEHRLNYTKRLIVQLGTDRDLLYLVYGPQPGRGRPLQVARQRGLAYWVALGLFAERLREPMPAAPPVVLGHWRQELYRLEASSPSRSLEVGIAGTPHVLGGDGPR